MNIDYKNKYIKYKEKYLSMKNLMGGFHKINFGEFLDNHDLEHEHESEYNIDIKYFNFFGFQNNPPYKFLNVELDKTKLINLEKKKMVIKLYLIIIQILYLLLHE